MSKIDELELLRAISSDINEGDEATKLQKEILAMEMSLGIVKQSIQEDLAAHEKRKAQKGYLWKGAKGMNTDKGNYAERVLSSHKRKLKKKKKKQKKKQNTKISTQTALAQATTSRTPSEAASCPSPGIGLVSSAKALQVAFIQSPHGAKIHEAFADITASEDHKQLDIEDQEQVDTSNTKPAIPIRTHSVKKACYHCLCLVVPKKDNKTVTRTDGKTFCDTKCLEEYLDQARVQCAEPQCDVKFERKFGARSKGKWYCKAHSKGKEAVGIMYSSSEPKSCHKQSFLD